MWKVALGIAVFLQAGATRADAGEARDEERTTRAPCTSSALRNRPTRTAPPTRPSSRRLRPWRPLRPAAVAAVAPAPTAFATVSFRNDVGKKLRLVEAHFAMDGEKLPVVLTSAEPGKSYVIVSGAVKPGPHVVTARLTYQGDRGIFSYMKGYKLNVQVQPGADRARRSAGQLHRRRQRAQRDDRSDRKTRGRHGRERREPEVRIVPLRKIPTMTNFGT